jgi:iron complex transport system substrate-binding protein
MLARRAVAAMATAAVLLAACSDDAAPNSAADAEASSTDRPSPSTASGPTTTAPVIDDRGPGPAPLTFPDGFGSAEADGVFPRTVTHWKGDTIIPAPPSRVVSIGTGQTDVLLTLGIAPVAAVAREGAETVQPYLRSAFPEMVDAIDQVASVGTNSNVNLEAIAALRPDLIVDNGGAEAELYTQLSAIAPTVITAGTGVNWKQDFRLIAAALGRAEAAEAFMADYDATAADLAAAVGANPPEVSFVRFNTGRARMFGIPSFTGSIAWDAGLDRPESQTFDETSQDLSEELIAAADADWLFYSIQGAAEETPAGSFLANPLWANLRAVRDDHVVVVEDDPWYLSAGPTAARVVLDTLVRTLSPS